MQSSGTGFRSMFPASGAALLAALLGASAALAAPADTLPPLKQFTAAGGALSVTLTMNRAVAPVTIGHDGAGAAIAVDALTTLTVCNAANSSECADPYAGAVLKLSPGDTLNARLVNGLGGSGGSMAHDCMDMTAPWDAAHGWSSVGGLLNQHYHGLLVPTTAGLPGDPARPFGDFIFTCTMGAGGTAQRNYRLPLSASHPLGIDWYHPHIHGIAKPQVASGMAGMILVGDPQCVDSSGPASCGTVRPILLKDAQLIKVPGANGTPHWLNFADQEPAFCDGSTFSASNLGSCPLSLPADTKLASGGVELTPIEGHWVFTLNGAQYPTLLVQDPQVWRVQNASANVTYRLSLRRLNGDATQVVTDAPFEVLSMDGAGLAGVPGGQYAPQTREILLMPGSRADLRLSRPDNGEAGDLIYQLVNEAFHAGFGPNDADTWPRIALAQVVFPAVPVMAAAGALAEPQTRALATLRTVRRAPNAQIANRIRVPVEESGAARLRGTPLSRAAGQVSEPPPAVAIEPPPDEAARAAAPSDRATATPAGARFAMARWLREDCDGYSAGDVLAEVDKLLQTALPGHQPIGSESERKQRYWKGLHFDIRTTHRRIYFGIQDADNDEHFVLGETLVAVNRNASGPPLIETDLYGRPIGPTNPVVLTTFNSEKGLCVLKRNSGSPPANVEQWELVNLSNEVHNFHIHQMKFTIARDVNGQAIMRTPSAADLVQLPASLLLTTGGGVAAELQHDTIVVPRGVTACSSSLKPLGAVSAAPGNGGMGHSVYAFMLDRTSANPSCSGLDGNQLRAPAGPRPPPDGSGMILVNMSFDGDWLAAARDGNDLLQPARFVFHCHILEHEDKGMMHRIAVLDPAPHP